MTEASTITFALDIGTRSVVGLLMRRDGQQLTFVDSVVKEHEERAMHDGQIHDVESVAAAITTVKKQLEEKHGPLKKVCVAAAGRALRTERAGVTIKIENQPLFSKEDILHLELSAVQRAQFKLAEQYEGRSSYYCVGYSVLHYELDGEPIGSLIDQAGKEATVNVIATFLPSVVIESLTAAVTRAGLEIEALTLEPIAAIHALIPPSMRRLNVALIDIGAGTSDIALTENNTVTAYGMVPFAGDEITEALSDHFLLDFPDAETVKRSLLTETTITLTDILGMESDYERDEIILAIEKTIDKLAKAISNEILTLNNGAPRAVMLIGGGSLTPKLTEKLSTYLNLQENRVAIRDTKAIKQLENNDTYFGPEFVTPIGIALSANVHAMKPIRITINEKKINLFQLNDLKVGDGLLAAGFHFSKLYGKPGLALMVTLNDQIITVKGGFGEPPILQKNGEQTTLDDRIEDGDVIEIQAGKDGIDAQMSISELIGEFPQVTINLNHEPIDLDIPIYRNEQRVSKDEILCERDIIRVNDHLTVYDLLLQKNIDVIQFEQSYVMLNSQKVMLPNAHAQLYVNGEYAKLHTILHDEDEVIIEQNKQNYTVADLLEAQQIQATHSVTVFYNEKPVTIEKQAIKIKQDGTELNLNSILTHMDQLTLEHTEHTPFILQDLFTVIELDLSQATGKVISIERNEQEANFTDIIQNGDKITIHIE